MLIVPANFLFIATSLFHISSLISLNSTLRSLEICDFHPVLRANKNGSYSCHLRPDTEQVHRNVSHQARDSIKLQSAILEHFYQQSHWADLCRRPSPLSGGILLVPCRQARLQIRNSDKWLKGMQSSDTLGVFAP